MKRSVLSEITGVTLRDYWLNYLIREKSIVLARDAIFAPPHERRSPPLTAFAGPDLRHALPVTGTFTELEALKLRAVGFGWSVFVQKSNRISDLPIEAFETLEQFLAVVLLGARPT